MVANTSYFSITTYWSIDCYWRGVCFGTIYLYAVLMEKQNKSQVVLSVVVGFLALFFIFKIDLFLYIASVAGLLGLLSDFFAGIITKAWLKLAEVMGRINGAILLSIIFFIILTPIALLMKIFKGTDELHLKKQTGTNYESRNHQYKGADLKNIW
ncbi:MAG: hypothetical protein ACI9IP_002837 [Arcticibacterium sp.]|jgi:hypothetical protein